MNDVRERLLRRRQKSSGAPAPDLSRQINSVNDTARQCATHYAGFLFLAGGLFILISGTTHEDLLRETPVQMPLFNIGVPLKTFYVLAPLIFLILHVNLLNKLAQLRTQFQELGPPEARSGLRTHLFQFDYALLLGGFVGKRSERVVLWLIVGLTLFVMPVMLLIFTQYKFLPYHSDAITWAHRIFVTTDICVLIFFHAALAPIRPFGNPRSAAVVGAMVVLPLASSCWLLTPPDRFLDSWGANVIWEWQKEDTFLGFHRNLHLVNRVFWQREPAPENIAMYESVHGFDDAVQQEALRRYGKPISLIGRDLRYANFDGSSLVNADFSYAHLAGASLVDSNMGGAKFVAAVLDNARLVRVSMERADMSLVEARNISIYDSNLSYATLDGGNFANAFLANVELENASGTKFKPFDSDGLGDHIPSVRVARVSEDRLERPTSFEYATFIMVSLVGANLTSANMKNVGMNNVDASAAELSDTKFISAELRHFSFLSASMPRSQFTDAILSYGTFAAADLRWASFQGSNLYNVDMEGIDLKEIFFDHNAMEYSEEVSNVMQGRDLSNFWSEIEQIARDNIKDDETLALALDRIARASVLPR